MGDRKMQRQYMNLKLSRNLTDLECAKKLGISRDKLIAKKKQWGINLRRQKDNMFGVSEPDFEKGRKIGLSRKLILNRVRDHGWTVEKAVNEPKDKTKMNNVRRQENE